MMDTRDVTIVCSADGSLPEGHLHLHNCFARSKFRSGCHETGESVCAKARGRSETGVCFFQHACR